MTFSSLWRPAEPLILASGSRTRRDLLASAGLPIEAIPAEIDERAVEAGVKQVVSAARAPFGSVYHFFPGGKQELAAEVLRGGGVHFLGLYETIAAGAPDMQTAVSRFLKPTR